MGFSPSYYSPFDLFHLLALPGEEEGKSVCVSGGKGVGGEQSLGGATMKSIKQKFPRALSSHSVRLRSDMFPPLYFHI